MADDNGTEPEPMTVILTSVEGKDIADLAMEFDSGKSFEGEAAVLYVLTLDADTKEKMPMTLVIPRVVGPELLLNLLTDEQWDAVTNA